MPRPPAHHSTSVVVATLVALAALVIGCGSDPGRDRAGATPPQADRWAVAWTGNDPDALAALFTPDATYDDLAFRYHARGTDAIREWVGISHRGIEGLRVDLAGASRHGDRIDVAWTFSGRVRAAPRPFSVPATSTMQLDGESIVRHVDSYDLAALLAQSGLPADWTPGGG